MQRAFSHTSRERKGKRGANKEPSTPSRRRLSLTHCCLPAGWLCSSPVMAFPCSPLTMVRCCAAQAEQAVLEQSGPCSSPACSPNTSRQVPSTYLAMLPLCLELRDGATLASFAWIGPSVTYFFLLIHPVSHANFLGDVSVCRSCLGCILWSAVPSAISSSPGFHAPPALVSLPEPILPDWQFLVLLIWEWSTDSTTGLSLHMVPLLVPC